ncbi:hypothetical protein CHS0354_015360 [Potamilus streckersoni]|uniref:Sodium/potassium-transporting ATPase subunit beta-1-interacting protein n=1 Tax=Potamilus streckersoni TaxID=2493646 RepID=A0AAE0WAF5_9BIVA|nr:hypothetical protein CHS0354_015360 [Potamilus streckersoni]
MFSTKETHWKRIFQLTMDCSKSKCASTALHTVIIVILSLQLLSTVERQVFDFLGYMWAPIIGNFFQIICVILGIFGTCQYRTRFIAVYTTWTLMWLGWNIFVICLYLEVGVLNRNREIYILNIGTRNKSWWLTHGIGCKVNDTWLRSEASQTITGRQIPPEEYVEGCILDYYYVEVIHASIQCLLSLIGFVFTCMAIYMFSEEDESSYPANDELEFVKMQNTQSSPRPARLDTSLHNDQENPAFDDLSSTRSNLPTLESPPSYETSIRNLNANAVNHYHYGSDRQSVRSVRSKASTRSTRSKAKQQRRENLPWVQITPSSHNEPEAPYRNFP